MPRYCIDFSTIFTPKRPATPDGGPLWSQRKTLLPNIEAVCRKTLQEASNLGNGPLGSVLFCIALADERGWRADATILRAALAADLERRGGTLPLNAILAFNTLARGAEEAGDYESTAHWARRALAMCAPVTRRQA